MKFVSTVSTFSTSIFHIVMGLDAMIIVFGMLIQMYMYIYFGGSGLAMPQNWFFKKLVTFEQGTCRYYRESIVQNG